jgi:hypothetical protein
VFDAHPEAFHWRYSEHWMSRIFVVFLMAEWGRADSPWRLLIANLARDIDLLAFWAPEELDGLEDPRMARQGLSDRQ